MVIAAVVLVLAVAAPVGCGGDGGVGPARLRSGSPASLLGRVAIDPRSFCTLAPSGEEEEGGLPGAVERAGVSLQYAGSTPDPLHSSVHVVLDRFPTRGSASAAVDAAGAALRQGLGTGARAEGSVAGWPGSTVFASRFVDYTGRERASFATAVAVGDTVVRVQSFGVPDIGSVTRFDRTAARLLAGLVGRGSVHAVPPC